MHEGDFLNAQIGQQKHRFGVNVPTCEAHHALIFQRVAGLPARAFVQRLQRIKSRARLQSARLFAQQSRRAKQCEHAQAINAGLDARCNVPEQPGCTKQAAAAGVVTRQGQAPGAV